MGLFDFLGDFIGAPENDFQAAPAQLDNPVSMGQAANAQNQNQEALKQQIAFVRALNGQGGLENQKAVFQMLMNQANGVGPNPAQAMLNQNTQQNVAQQAALMGSQRGIGSNPGLLARQAANVGSNIQQQGVGQAATMQANQQLNTQALLAQLAGQQVNQQAQGLSNLNQFGQNNQQMLLNAIAQHNAANVQNQGNVNSINAGVAQQNQQTQNQLLGGLINASGAAATMGGNSKQPGTSPGFAHGGMVGDSGSATCAYLNKYASGGMVPGKATTAGDSVKNDKVKAMLSPGEIIIPRTHASTPEKAADFVRAVLAKRR